MADVFISYHEESAGDMARQIADALENIGISCWYARGNMPIGGDFAREITPQINECRLFLLLLTEGVYQSRHIENEVGLAFSRLNKGENILILPLEIGNFTRREWVAYYLIHTQSVKIAFLDSVNKQDLTKKIADSLGITPQEPEPPPTPERTQTTQIQPESKKPQLTRKPNKFKAIIKRMFVSLAAILVLLLSSLLFLRSYHPTWKVEKKGNLDGGAILTISGKGEMDYGTALSRFLLNGRELPPYYPPWYRDSAIVTEAVVESGVTEIKTYAFYNFSRLESVSISDSVTYIGYQAFYDCGRLQEVVIPNSVTEIGEEAFSGCAKLYSVEIPDSVTKIGMWAFLDCTKLYSVEIPDSVTEIGAEAFKNCSNLTSAVVPWGLDITDVFPKDTKITRRE